MSRTHGLLRTAPYAIERVLGGKTQTHLRRERSVLAQYFLPPSAALYESRREVGRASLRRFALTRKSTTSQQDLASSPDDDSDGGGGGSSNPSFCMPILTVSSAIAAATSPSRNARLCGAIRAPSAAGGSMYQEENLAHLYTTRKQWKRGRWVLKISFPLTRNGPRKGTGVDRCEHDFRPILLSVVLVQQE